MAGLAELARHAARLSEPEIDHLQRLVATWSLLADLCFSDLMLFGEKNESFVVLGQIRPTTGQTYFPTDWIGRELPTAERPLVSECFATGDVIDGFLVSESHDEQILERCIPVRYEGRTIAVLTRESASSTSRQPGVLEQVYVETFDRLAEMVADGTFPFKDAPERGVGSPRVGDGVVIMDGAGVVTFASPNAVSAFHRIGVHFNLEGERFEQVGVAQEGLRLALKKGRPSTEEVERTNAVTVLLRFIPLLRNDKVDGALLLVRDISELRRRDLLLLSKDATIREIHHRVKNNLQTISALLRLQGRRLSTPEAKAAVEESSRRIRSIALVHETLSHTIGDDVPFTEIVRPLVRMVEEGLSSPDRPVKFTVNGDAGILSADSATPLAVVITELLQNAVDHAFAGIDLQDFSAVVEVDLENTDGRFRISVTDNGIGIPQGFSIDDSTGLGLSIVRTLVTTELGGTIGFSRGNGPASRPGTNVRISVPLPK